VKAIVFLLLLANLLFYAFDVGYLGHPDNPDAGRLEQQVRPERMRIVSRGEPPVAPARSQPLPAEAKPVEPPPILERSEDDKPVPVAPEVRADKSLICLSWRPLSVSDADRLTALLAKRFGDYKLTRKAVASEGNGWWVSIPPLPGKAEAEKKSVELRELGVTDFFVVPDGASRFAISLGVFSTEKSGQDRLAELKLKGVRSAVVTPRPGKDSQVALVARGPAEEKAALLGAVGQALPKAETLACK
jgi:hypothetical protein